MTCTKLPFGQFTLRFLLSLVLAPGLSQPAQPKVSTTTPSNQPAVWHFSSRSRTPAQVAFDPPPPPDRGAPGHREGTAGRCDNCSQVYPPLTAIVPVYQTSDGEKSVWGLTLAEHPTLWFYLPYTVTRDRIPKFVLQDEDGLEIYKATLQATGRLPGVISFRFPSTVAPLEIGKRYHWIFSIQGLFVDGWVERIAPLPKLVSQLKTATPRERIAVYAANGIWYETLTALAELCQENPKDAKLEGDWVALLQAIGLKDITPKPIVQCCTPEK